MLSVLVVDDIPDNVKLLSYDLKDAGYEVLTAANGMEALDVIREVGPPIVLSDWMMPEMDGIELCRAIREQSFNTYTYIIMLTAHSDRCRLVEAFDAGADDFLAKPFDQPELLARIHAGVRIVQLESDLARERLQLHKTNAELAILNRKLRHWATTDDLTGLRNRREAIRYLEDCWSTARRHDRALACLVIDIDRFKSYNDRFGHAVGDVVLRETAEVLQRATRSAEHPFRTGGEEFVVICPLTGGVEALRAGERLRAAIAANTVLCGERELQVTVSIGTAHMTSRHDCADALLRSADQALYAAKAAGRNRVVAAETPLLVDATQRTD
jgi:two-component system cell cycle response regulator